MKIPIGKLDSAVQQKLLTSIVVPRPIALVSTRSLAGVDNAAPFSLFNIFGEAPPVVILGIHEHADGRLKDTARNILETGEFVVNMVDEAMAEAMRVCATDFPPSVSEPALAGLSLVPGDEVNAPRLAQSPVGLECRRLSTLHINPRRTIVIGEVVFVHVQDGLMDPGNYRMHPDKYHPIGRMFGQLYTRTTDRFELWVEKYDERAGADAPTP